VVQVENKNKKAGIGFRNSRNSHNTGDARTGMGYSRYRRVTLKPQRLMAHQKRPSLDKVFPFKGMDYLVHEL
jgi:hypothetical protein